MLEVFPRDPPMRLVVSLLSASLLLAGTPPPAASKDPASLALNQVLAKFYEAQGGLARLKHIQSRRVHGHLEGLPGKVSFDQINARPDRYRLETRTIPAVGAPVSIRVKTCAGKMGWTWSEGQVPQQLTPTEVQVLDADFDGPCVDAEAKGNRLDYLGIQIFRDQKAVVIRVTLQDGRIQTLYLDPRTYLKFAQVNGEGKAGMELDFRDYRAVEGMPMAFTVITGPVSVRVDRIDLNIPVTDAEFQPPTGK